MEETHQGGINDLLKFSRPHWLEGDEEDEEGSGGSHLEEEEDEEDTGRTRCHLGSPARRGHSSNINNKNLK